MAYSGNNAFFSFRGVVILKLFPVVFNLPMNSNDIVFLQASKEMEIVTAKIENSKAKSKEGFSSKFFSNFSIYSSNSTPCWPGHSVASSFVLATDCMASSANKSTVDLSVTGPVVSPCTCNLL